MLVQVGRFNPASTTRTQRATLTNASTPRTDVTLTDRWWQRQANRRPSPRVGVAPMYKKVDNQRNVADSYTNQPGPGTCDEETLRGEAIRLDTLMKAHDLDR